MSYLTINRDKCRRDGICAETCPRGIIELRDEKSYPAIIDGMETLCIECGHCVAVCPHGALSHKIMSPEQCPQIKKEWILSPEQAEVFLRMRRSIRIYKDKPVDKESISKLIEIARYAPSGHNSQPVEWLVINNKAEIHKLAGLVIDWMKYMLEKLPEIAIARHMDSVVAGWEKGKDTICRKAHHMIIAHASMESRTAPKACIVALSYLELAAASMGLGTCWAGYFNDAIECWPPMREAVSLPEGHISYGAMMLGYPKFKYHRLPLRKEPKITWHE